MKSNQLVNKTLSDLMAHQSGVEGNNVCVFRSELKDLRKALTSNGFTREVKGSRGDQYGHNLYWNEEQSIMLFLNADEKRFTLSVSENDAWPCVCEETY